MVSRDAEPAGDRGRVARSPVDDSGEFDARCLQQRREVPVQRDPSQADRRHAQGPR
jgi:hypothetical protein